MISILKDQNQILAQVNPFVDNKFLSNFKNKVKDHHL